ncbi:TetR family transcriptional regulator [Arthrobacter sp. 35W]|uniref:TetR family transcriptional regulator n=1 Tax=Arthrobacter sp. 35W TaxID=1132441 RepID=UPI000411035B|nr:TetR family transcriptional regulator [Arthrobacter sp. 35W]
MAWDTENTKRSILAAAVAEFSQYGLAGARVDRIAAAAGFSKERIYQYFGKKDELFAIALEHELAAVMDAVTLEGMGVEAVVGYAGRLFDYHQARPALARLTFWEGLERTEPIALAMRAERAEAKIAMLRTALPELSTEEAQELLLSVLALTDGWQAMGTTDRIYSGAAAATPERTARRRRTVLLAVEALARALSGSARD